MDGNTDGTTNGFEFTIANGQVTAMERVFGTRTVNLPLPSDATFAVATDTVTETITHSKSTDVITFTQNPSDASLYDVTSTTDTITTPTTTFSNGTTSGFSFTITNGTVTGVQAEWSNAAHSHSQNLPISPSASFAVGSGTVTETLVFGNDVQSTTFVQPSGSTLYAVSSVTDTFIQPGSATTLLSVDPFQRDEFTINAGGTVTQVQSLSPKGTLTAITPNSHTAFTQLATGFVEETQTYGVHSGYEVFYDGSGGGIYTEVAHGNGTTVDLVGLKAQLAQLPPMLEALV